MLVTLKVTDSQSGILSENAPTSSGSYGAIGEVAFISPSGRQEIEVDILSSQRIKGDKFSATYQVPIILSDYHEPGKWSLVDLELIDNAGNEQDVERDGEWDTPLTDAERFHMAKRLGVDPDSIKIVKMSVVIRQFRKFRLPMMMKK